MDISALKCIAENSGRETFITDKSFNVIWTNSESHLIQIMMIVDKQAFGAPPKKEMFVSCSDGRMLRIMPVIENGAAELFVFELYDPNDIIMMLMATPVIENYKKRYDNTRSSLFQYITEIIGYAEVMHLREYDGLMSYSANRMALLNMLTERTEKHTVDVALFLREVFSYLDKLSSRAENFEMEYHLEDGLYAYIGLGALEYVIVNMFTNSFAHCKCDGVRKLCMRSYRSGDSIIIEAEDNGTDADLDKINRYRSIYTPERKDFDKECVGISILEMFARKNNGRLDFYKTESGGLKTVIALPYKKPSDMMELCAPDNYDDSHAICMQILKAYFPDIDPNAITFMS